MAAIVIENLSTRALDVLERRAAERRRTVAEELAALVEASISADEASPVFNQTPPSLDIPYELPRQGERTVCRVVPGQPRLPDPVFPIGPGEEE